MKTLLATGLALTLSTGAALADSYTVTVTNTLGEELLAPILVTDASNDGKIFSGDYVTEAAEHQILTGDPAKVVQAVGEGMAAVGHGMAGPPGVLLPAGESVTFSFETDATALRILAMVAPTMVPDNYVSNVVDVSARDSVTVNLDRYDIGFDEETMKTMFLTGGAATVEITRN